MQLRGAAESLAPLTCKAEMPGPPRAGPWPGKTPVSARGARPESRLPALPAPLGWASLGTTAASPGSESSSQNLAVRAGAWHSVPVPNVSAVCVRDLSARLAGAAGALPLHPLGLLSASAPGDRLASTPRQTSAQPLGTAGAKAVLPRSPPAPRQSREVSLRSKRQPAGPHCSHPAPG